MKKFILPLLLLLAIGMLAAVESAPSDVVGYFRKNINSGSWQAICMPFAYADLSVGSVVGDQFNEGDVLMDINSGLSTTYYDGYGWDGELTDIAYGNAYYVNRQAAGPATYYLLGKVDPQGFSKTINGNGSYTAFGLNEAAVVPVAVGDHPFGTHPVEGDVILEIDTGLTTTYYEGYGWDGELLEIAPAVGYYYNRAVGASSFLWVYTPTRNATQPSLFNTRSKK